jgi:hypothetical protein
MPLKAAPDVLDYHWTMLKWLALIQLYLKRNERRRYGAQISDRACEASKG